MAPSTKQRNQGSEELRKVRDRELELRQLSGAVSCADCRRLKLKCDRKIPCSSCVRRGAEGLCPLGARGRDNQSGRSAQASRHSQGLNRKLTILSERIRALEDALALESEARGGSGSHPLLTEELLALKQSLNDDESDEEEVEEEEEDQLLGSFGTLSIDESRTMRYLGPAASENALLMEVLENSAPQLPITGTPSESGHLGREIIHSSKSFPFAPLFLDNGEDSLFDRLVSYLPPFERATALYEAFFRNLSWFTTPVERSHFVSEVVPLFYPQRKPVTAGSIHSEHAHDLALLFILFACGAAGDLTQTPMNDEAAHFHTLAKAALGVKSIMHGASLASVQALFLLASYDMYTGEKKSQEDAWKVTTLGCSMAAAVSVFVGPTVHLKPVCDNNELPVTDRDPSRWGFDTKIIERRRRVFWEIYTTDNWVSIESGRPSIFRPGDIDCEFPSDIFATVGEDGEVVESVNHWRFRFVRDVTSEVSEKLVSARPLSYRDVLELDRKIRDFAVHPSATEHRPREGDLGIDEDFHKLYALITTWCKLEALLDTHRNFFARAILDFPANPMRSPFAASFLATYRSASSVIRMCRENMHAMYLTILRIWNVWSLCLNCGVIAGVVASLGPSVSFATSAFVELEYTIALFEEYGGHKVAKHGLPLLRRIREKAIAALCRPQTAEDPSTLPTIRKATDNTDNELLILRGITRIVEHHAAKSPSNRENALPDAVSNAATPRKSSVFDNHSFPRIPLTAHDSQHNMSTEDVFGARSPGMDTRQSPGDLHVPQTETNAWLAELEEMLGSSAVSQPPNIPGLVGDQQAASVEIPFDWQASSFPPRAMAVPNVTYGATNVPIADFGGDTVMTDAFPDVLLNETVSTGEWRQLMEQSGFSSTPPFDFTLDSFVPLASPSTTEWHPNLGTS